MKKVCRHEGRWVERRWLSKDGTPMVHFYCPECGFDDTGHVHADPVGWEGMTINIPVTEKVEKIEEKNE